MLGPKNQENIQFYQSIEKGLSWSATTTTSIHPSIIFTEFWENEKAFVQKLGGVYKWVGGLADSESWKISMKKAREEWE